MAGIIAVEGLAWRYATGQDWAIADVTFEIQRGEFVVVTGPTGAGKTTLSLCLSGLIPHNYNGVWKGNVFLDGHNTKESSPTDLSEKVGIVFQDPDSQFLTMSVRDEISFGPENLALPRQEIGERVSAAAETVRLSDCLDRAPYELSGGQKQRVAIAAALAMQPEVLILDEPTSQLDPIGKAEVFAVLQDLRRSNNITVVLVEHSLEDVVGYADRFLLMNEGRMQIFEPPERFFSNVEYLTLEGVPVPQVIELANLQTRRGVKLGRVPLTVESAVGVFSRSISE